MIDTSDRGVRGALFIWGELTEALHGVNSYGGDTAEIYVYRLLHAKDSFALATDASDREITAAAALLWSVLALFRQEHDVEITIDGRAFGGWLMEQQNRHRWHVQIRERAPASPDWRAIVGRALAESPAMKQAKHVSRTDVATDVAAAVELELRRLCPPGSR